MKLKEAIKLLSSAGVPEAEYDARALFRYVGKVSMPITADCECPDDIISDAIQRRAEREPLQYIIGEVGFYRETYKVSEDCLIPRSDTEILVEFAEKNIPKGESFIDFCSGSGCVAISTLKNTDNTRAIALDISDGALNIAKENARVNGVSDRLRFIKCDVLGNLPSEVTEEKFYALLSNPPYVREKDYEALEDEIYHEPRIAFVGGEDGLEFYRRLIPLTLSIVKDEGFSAFEIGFDQADDMRRIAKELGLTAQIIKDYSGNDRVAIFKRA